jgi:small subunit ribosomal protein S17
VVGDKMQKTVVVAVEWVQRHRLYRKSVRRFTKFVAHDEQNDTSLGDLVRIVETRPLSKTKRWRVTEVLERREIPEIQPVEIDVRLEEGLRGTPTTDAGADVAAQVEKPVEEAAVAVAVAEAEEATAVAEAEEEEPATAEAEEAPAVAEAEEEPATAEAEEAPAAEAEGEPATAEAEEAPVAEAEEEATGEAESAERTDEEEEEEKKS